MQLTGDVAGRLDESRSLGTLGLLCRCKNLRNAKGELPQEYFEEQVIFWEQLAE